MQKGGPVHYVRLDAILRTPPRLSWVGAHISEAVLVEVGAGVVADIRPFWPRAEVAPVLRLLLARLRMVAFAEFVAISSPHWPGFRLHDADGLLVGRG